MTNKQRKSISIPIVILVVLLLLPLLYVGAYIAMLDGQSYQAAWGYNPMLSPSYRYGGEFSHKFFSPVHHVDSHYVRPGYWRDDLDLLQ